MKTAEFIRELNSEQAEERGGMVALYRLSEPHEGHEYVVLSAIKWRYTAQHPRIGDPWTIDFHETYIFAATADGEWSARGVLGGALKDTTDHAEVLGALGYTIIQEGQA